MKTVQIELTRDEAGEVIALVDTTKNILKMMVLTGQGSRDEQRKMRGALTQIQSVSRKLEVANAALQNRPPKPTATEPRNRKTPRASRTR